MLDGGLKGVVAEEVAIPERRISKLGLTSDANGKSATCGWGQLTICTRILAESGGGHLAAVIQLAIALGAACGRGRL